MQTVYSFFGFLFLCFIRELYVFFLFFFSFLFLCGVVLVVFTACLLSFVFMGLAA